MTEHCKRHSGTDRAWFETSWEAAAYRDENPAYFRDIVVFCGRCSFFHCSSPSWTIERPWETPVERLRIQ